MAEQPFSIEIQVRFRDLDAMRHVNNAVYFSYMELARTQFYLKAMGLGDLEDIAFILAHASCDFRSPIEWGETVVVSVRPVRIGTSSFEFAYELRSKTSGTVFAVGTSVQVAYDYAARTSKPVPDNIRRALEAEIRRLGGRPSTRPPSGRK